ncbi:hypothetical protein ACO22_07027, partial [Paracoccidioides brasiliensis]
AHLTAKTLSGQKAPGAATTDDEIEIDTEKKNRPCWRNQTWTTIDASTSDREPR